MAYEVVMPYHLHMPSYFLETFTEYPFLKVFKRQKRIRPETARASGRIFICLQRGLVFQFCFDEVAVQASDVAD